MKRLVILEFEKGYIHVTTLKHGYYVDLFKKGEALGTRFFVSWLDFYHAVKDDSEAQYLAGQVLGNWVRKDYLGTVTRETTSGERVNATTKP